MRESDREFFKPLWRRIAVTLFCAAWAGWEWSRSENLWATMLGVATAYCIWTYFITFDADKKAD